MERSKNWSTKMQSSTKTMTNSRPWVTRTSPETTVIAVALRAALVMSHPRHLVALWRRSFVQQTRGYRVSPSRRLVRSTCLTRQQVQLDVSRFIPTTGIAITQALACSEYKRCQMMMTLIGKKGYQHCGVVVAWASETRTLYPSLVSASYLPPRLYKTPLSHQLVTFSTSRALRRC